jgi:hypothetical protein
VKGPRSSQTESIVKTPFRRHKSYLHHRRSSVDSIALHHLHHHPHSYLICNLDLMAIGGIVTVLLFKIFNIMFTIVDQIMCE